MPHSNPRTHRHSTLPSDMRPHNRKSDSLYWFLLSALTAIRQKESIILQTVSFDNLSAFILARIRTSRTTPHRSNSLPDPLEKCHPSCTYAFRTRLPNRRSECIRTTQVAFITRHPHTSDRAEAADAPCTPYSRHPRTSDRAEAETPCTHAPWRPCSPGRTASPDAAGRL